jgi:hypothetical protein
LPLPKRTQRGRDRARVKLLEDVVQQPERDREYRDRQQNAKQRAG